MTTMTKIPDASSTENTAQNAGAQLDHAAMPAYARTNSTPFFTGGIDEVPAGSVYEAQARMWNFFDTLWSRDPAAGAALDRLIAQERDPVHNGALTHGQAKFIARQARRFDREGDTFARDSAELALNASGLLLDDVRPRSMAEMLQADREGRRARELRSLLTPGL